MDRDGAGTSARRFSPTFVVVTKPCSLLLPTREPDIQPFTTKNKELAFQCQLDGGNVECSINHTDDLGTRDYMFTAPILKNTSKALQFATPKRLIDVSADVKTGDATVSQRGPNGAVTCDATYVTIETWNKVLREMREKQRASSRNSGGGGYAPAPTTSSPRAEPRPPAPKGSAKGHMCGKNKDCQSGVCAMENKTRGRCQ